MRFLAIHKPASNLLSIVTYTSRWVMPQSLHLPETCGITHCGRRLTPCDSFCSFQCSVCTSCRLIILALAVTLATNSTQSRNLIAQEAAVADAAEEEDEMVVVEQIDEIDFHVQVPEDPMTQLLQRHFSNV